MSGAQKQHDVPYGNSSTEWASTSKTLVDNAWLNVPRNYYHEFPDVRKIEPDIDTLHQTRDIGNNTCNVCKQFRRITALLYNTKVQAHDYSYQMTVSYNIIDIIDVISDKSMITLKTRTSLKVVSDRL